MALAQANPAIMQIAGDLIFKSLDLPYADDIAARMKIMLPPPIQQMEAEGKELPPEAMAAMAQATQAMQMVEQQTMALQQAGAEVQQVITLLIPVLFLSARASPWTMRYATWFPAMLCLTTACFLEALPRDLRGERRTLGVLLVLGAALNVLPTLIYGRIPLDEFKRMLAKPALERSAAGLYMTIGDTYEFAVATVPDDEVLGYHVSSNGFIYPLYGGDLSQRVAYVHFGPTTPCPEVVEAVRAAGTRWLFLGYTSWRDVDRVRACTQDGYFTFRGENLYELNPPPHQP